MSLESISSRVKLPVHKGVDRYGTEGIRPPMFGPGPQLFEESS